MSLEASLAGLEGPWIARLGVASSSCSVLCTGHVLVPDRSHRGASSLPERKHGDQTLARAVGSRRRGTVLRRRSHAWLRVANAT
jgi:hypothetical protein